MSEAKPTPWSPARDLVSPAPGGHNRLLDRAAAEHLRKVAPHLAPKEEPAKPPLCRTCLMHHRDGENTLCSHFDPQPAGARDTCPGCGGTGVVRVTGITPDGRLGSVDTNCSVCAQLDAPAFGVGHRDVKPACAPAPPAEAKHHEEDCVRRECRPELHSAQPPAEAKGEEMTAVGLRIALDAFYRQGYYAGMADMSGNREMVQEHADRAEVAVKPVLDAFAALRTRAREESERAEKTTEHLLNSVAKAVRRGDELESERDEARQEARWLAEVFIATGHATPDIHAWLDRAKHCVGTLRESLTAANERVDALLLERDEAREQREDLANEILAERSDLAAANARAEEAESERVTANEAASDADRVADTERAARVKAEEDVAALKAGANEVAKLMTALRERLAAAEAEVARLRGDLAAERRLTLSYDDPSLDGTDGAHPAWGRGFDTGATVAAVMVEATIDKEEPQCLTGGNADVLRAVSRVAALRASVARLVEAGDMLYHATSSGPYSAEPCAAWRAAKADAPAKEQKP